MACERSKVFFFFRRSLPRLWHHNKQRGASSFKGPLTSMAALWLLTSLLLCLVCFSGLLQAASIPLSSDEDCPYEPLPDSLDNLAGVGFAGELHSHSNYIANYTGLSHDTFFTLSQQSEFKIYIEHSSVDIDIWLYNAATGNQITVCLRNHW